MQAAPIELAPGAEQSAFAGMIAELVRANLADQPAKGRHLTAMRGRVALIADDISATITLHFKGGRLSVHAGFHGVPDVVVRGPSQALIDLSRLPNHPRFDFLPDFRSPIARALARALYTRKLRITGASSHASLALHLTRVLSIHGEVALEIEQKHGFSHDEAMSRANALADYLSKRHGMNVERTSENGFRLHGKYTVVSIDVTVTVHADKVHVTGRDPGMLWRSQAKAYIARKLDQYLNPAATLETLPRA